MSRFKRISKSRHRKTLLPRRASKGLMRFRVSNMGPVIKIAGLAVAVAALVMVVIFVIVPLFGGAPAVEESVKPSSTPTPTPSPIAGGNMSDAAEELSIHYSSINDPYIYGDEIVFSTGEADQLSPEIKTIAVYNMTTGETTEIPEITKQNNSLFEPKINENYIVYLDCKSEYGGAVCGYDRNTKEIFIMRDYLYGKPKVSLVGDYALWMQQTGNATDKLYLYCLPTRETTVIEVFVNTPFSISAPYMSDEAIIYVQPDGESLILDGSSASMTAQICIIPLKENGDNERVLFYPDTDVYDPVISGDYVLFLDSNRDDQSRLMLCEKQGDTYSAPVAIAQGVLNYRLGDGFVAYTQEDAVYVYYFGDQSSGRVSSDTTRALLSSVNEKEIIWYDITDDSGETADIIMHLTVP